MVGTEDGSREGVFGEEVEMSHFVVFFFVLFFLFLGPTPHAHLSFQHLAQSFFVVALLFNQQRGIDL